MRHTHKMKRLVFWVPLMVVAIVLGSGAGRLFADDLQTPPASEKPKSEPSKTPSLETLTQGTKKIEGLWTLYTKDQQVLVDLPNSQLDQNFIVSTSIARGISNGAVIGGMSWGVDNSIIWAFRKKGDKIQVLRRNVRFRANPGTPEANAVKISYSDSILYALPILTATPNGQLVDMTSIFMSDDQEIGRYIGMGFHFVSDRSTLAEAKAFPKNVEIQIAAVYSGMQDMDTVADPRGVQVHVHYSISLLPDNGYKPRVADDRVGYFVSAVKDFSNPNDDQNFVRYINRWNLKKKDPTAKLSPPEEPIVFYIEKTVPVRLRPYVQAGIEEWNKAFEKLGFSNAIVVLQQRDDDDWDPEDIRYNTFRWTTADSGFAMGPIRVNPMTGQILDADIIFDASFLEYWKQDYEMFTKEDVAALMGGIPGVLQVLGTGKDPRAHARLPGSDCMLPQAMQQQMGYTAAALTVNGQTQRKLPDEFIHEALKAAVMHEVGHALGLRHNFKGSTWKSLEAINAVKQGECVPTVGSVMDYAAANVVPQGKEQGTYFTPTIGPYDLWAIEYGYKPIDGDESEALKTIASREGQDGLDYATDEDSGKSDPDPTSNLFDLGKDILAYARQQMSSTSSLLPKIVDRTVIGGEGYQRARQAFGMLLSEYWRSAYLVARVPGGVYVHREHKGDGCGLTPFKVVEAAKQREAMQLLAETAFASPTFDPCLLNHLAATRWIHWGVRNSGRLDYPIHEVVEKMQVGILAQLLNPLTLARLQDNELKVEPGDDAYTLDEHLRTITRDIFSELFDPKPGSYETRSPFITSFRRNLQRITLKAMANIVTAGTDYPVDSRTLCRMHLTELNDAIEAILRRADLKLDDYSKAYLLDSKTIIQQVLTAHLNFPTVS